MKMYRDFFGNYHYFSKNKEDRLKIDMIREQIAALMLNRRAALIDTMNQSGIDVKPDVSDKKLIDAIMENLENKQFRYGLALLISKNNKKSMDKHFKKFPKKKIKKYSKATGDKVQLSFDPVSAVADGIGKLADLFKSGAERKQAREEQKNMLWLKYAQLKEGQQEQAARGARVTAWVVGGIVVTTVLIFGFIALRATRKS